MPKTVVKIEFGAVGGSSGATGAATSTILFMSDAAALLEIDGQRMGELPGGAPGAPANRKVAVSPGRHVLKVAAKEDPRVSAQFDVKLGESAQEIVRLSLDEKVKALKAADSFRSGPGKG